MSSSSSSTKIGLCQMLSTNDKNHNRDQVKELFSRAKGKAEFLFLPECCDYVGKNVEETLNLAEPLKGSTVEFYRKLCKENEMWGSFGGIHEISDEHSGKVFNTHIIINSNGELVTMYRKLHLFDVDTPDFKFRESKIVSPGSGVVEPIETPIGKIGLQICYDIRFPECPIWLKQQGAQILTYPSAFSVATGKAHWDILNRSRAIENQCFVISSAQQGKHNEKRSSYGQAIAVSPWGDIIGRCTEELEVQFVEIDVGKIAKIEANMPCFQHRRDNVYSLEIKTADYIKESNCSNESFVFEKYPIDFRTIFLETKHCVAFTNIRCVVPGHVLIATKRIIPRLHQMTVAETKELFTSAKRVAQVLEKHHNARSMTITVQDGEYAGQTVKHVHCHVMPRKPGDFEHNDEIYVRLNEHDQENTEKSSRRTLEEMAEEAEIYRKLLCDEKL